MVDDRKGCEWVNVFFWYRLTHVVPDKGSLNGCLVVLLCVCGYQGSIVSCHMLTLCPCLMLTKSVRVSCYKNGCFFCLGFGFTWISFLLFRSLLDAVRHIMNDSFVFSKREFIGANCMQHSAYATLQNSQLPFC